MNIKLGNLNFIPVTEHSELLAEPVIKMLSTIGNNEKVNIVEINPNFSDTTTFCKHYEVKMNQVANCVVLEAKRADKSWFAVCVILSNTKADVNGLIRKTLNARKVSFASMEQAVAQTRMEYGGICPIGIPNDWPILIDKAVADSEYVIIGSGIRGSKIAVSGAFLALLPNAILIEGLAKPNI